MPNLTKLFTKCSQMVCFTRKRLSVNKLAAFCKAVSHCVNSCVSWAISWSKDSICCSCCCNLSRNSISSESLLSWCFLSNELSKSSRSCVSFSRSVLSSIWSPKCSAVSQISFSSIIVSFKRLSQFSSCGKKIFTLSNAL